MRLFFYIIILKKWKNKKPPPPAPYNTKFDGYRLRFWTKKKKLKKTKEGPFPSRGVKRHFVLFFYFIFEISSGRPPLSLCLWVRTLICKIHMYNTYLAYAYIHTAIHNENSDKTFWEDLLPCYRLLDTSSRNLLCMYNTTDMTIVCWLYYYVHKTLPLLLCIHTVHTFLKFFFLCK